MAEPDRRGRRRGLAQAIAVVWPPWGAGHAGGAWAAAAAAWPPLADRLKEWLRAEAGAGRLLPWVPVAFGGGIALYFSADHEPVLWLSVRSLLSSGPYADANMLRFDEPYRLFLRRKRLARLPCFGQTTTTAPPLTGYSPLTGNISHGWTPVKHLTTRYTIQP